MIRPRHVVEDRITLFVRPFGAYHVYGTFAGGSHCAYVTFKEFSINSESNFSHSYCNGYEHVTLSATQQAYGFLAEGLSCRPESLVR